MSCVQCGKPADGDVCADCWVGDEDADQAITCPRCGRTSYNPNDIREGYCGACHDWTAKR